MPPAESDRIRIHGYALQMTETTMLLSRSSMLEASRFYLQYVSSLKKSYKLASAKINAITVAAKDRIYFLPLGLPAGLLPFAAGAALPPAAGALPPDAPYAP